eukprot:COSAG01_NODE_1090_length_11748_cov_58.142244_7_plen_77_part_00
MAIHSTRLFIARVRGGLQDCHKDCPSCTTPCAPMSKSLVIPAGTKLLMAWHTVGLDATAFPEPKKVRAIITSLAAS